MVRIVAYAVPFYILSYTGQILLKRGVNTIGGLSADVFLRDPVGTMTALVLNGNVPLGLLLMAGGSFFYLFLLSLGDFSYVLPLLGALSFFALPVIGVVILHEPVTIERVIGIIIIAIGAIIVART